MLVTVTNLTDQHYNGRNGQAITLIGIHTMEAPETATTAEAVANYFKTVQASAHWCVDDGTRVRVVNDEDGAWTMPPTNYYSLNVEMAGYAAQTPPEWDDQYSLDTMDNAAVCVAEWCKKYDIPVRHLTDEQIAANAKGLAGHVDVNRVFHSSDHVDPGPNFPWDHFLGLVNHHLGTMPPKPNCTAFQKAIRTQTDNVWGPDTDKHATAIIDASVFGGVTFPFGTAFTQTVVGAKDDGSWGPSSKAFLKTTTLAAQQALKAMSFNPGTPDGVWGPLTDKAYRAARAACTA